MTARRATARALRAGTPVAGRARRARPAAARSQGHYAPAPRVALTLQGREQFDGLPAATTLRRWVRAALALRPPAPVAAAQLTVRFVGAREGRRLNRTYRHRDYATNVLTFDYGRRPLAADIVLCVPVARREAAEQGKTLREHLAHLVVHAVLHARGMDHATGSQAARMEARERRTLAELGYADPYAPTRIPGAAAGRRLPRPGRSR